MNDGDKNALAIAVTALIVIVISIGFLIDNDITPANRPQKLTWNASSAEILLDQFSYTADVLSMYQERVTNESYLDQNDCESLSWWRLLAPCRQGVNGPVSPEFPWDRDRL